MDRRRFLSALGATATTVPLSGVATSSGSDSGRTTHVGLPEQAASDVEATRPSFQQQTSVMQEKVNQAVNTLETDGLGTEVYEAAITEGMEGLFPSNIAVLESPNVPVTADLFSTWLSHASFFEQGLDTHINDKGTSESKAKAMDGRNFLQLTTEAMQEINKKTKNCDASNPENCPEISRPSEPQTQQARTQSLDSEPVIDAESNISGFHRQVRMPFFMGFDLTRATRNTPTERVVKTDSLWPDQCQAILKETRGVKAIVRPVYVPIWVEPWQARAQIVGTELIWIWEFIPAQFLKTVEYCNNSGDIEMTVDTKVHLDRKLNHFWRFLRN